MDTARASAAPVRALVRIDLFIGVFLSAPLGGGDGCVVVPARSAGARRGLRRQPPVRPSAMAVVLARIIRR
ncbi:hypothetical protein GCM10020227_56720 [Streptomyces flavovirens]